MMYYVNNLMLVKENKVQTSKINILHDLGTMLTEQMPSIVTIKCKTE